MRPAPRIGDETIARGDSNTVRRGLELDVATWVGALVRELRQARA
jgi:hypothetical protein